MLQALHSKSAAKARQGAHFWASMIEQEEEEEEKETGIEFATTYLPHMPALVEGLVASLICLAEAGDLPGRPADCLILLCRFLFTSVRSSLHTPMPHYYIFSLLRSHCHNNCTTESMELKSAHIPLATIIMCIPTSPGIFIFWDFSMFPLQALPHLCSSFPSQSGAHPPGK